MAVVVAAKAELVTLDPIEIAAVGIDWHAATGDITLTQKHLQDAIRASQDPTLESARIKIGHDDPTPWSPGGEPAFGKLVDFSLSDNGMTLLAKPVDVPKWLGEIAPSAFPNRSMEAWFEFTSNAGKFYTLYIDAVALLGVHAPAIGSLEELSAYYGDTMPDGVKVDASRKQVFFEGRIQADATQVDVMRTFYDTLDSGGLMLPEDEKLGYWSFVREFYVSPPRLIVEDDESGQLWSVGYAVDGNEVKFEPPEKVTVQYVAAMRGVKAATFKDARTARASYPKEESSVDIAKLRARLGDEANDLSDDEVIDLAAAKLGASDPDPTPDPDPDPAPDPEPTVPEGTVLVEAGVWQQTQSSLDRLLKRDEERTRVELEAEVDGWVNSGRISRFNRAAFLKRHILDPDGTRQTVAQLEPGTVPVDTERGNNGGGEDFATSATAYPSSWLGPQELARINAAQSGGGQRRYLVELRD